MAEVSDSSNVWMFKEEWIGRQDEMREKNANGELVIVQPYIEGKRTESPVPPKKVDKRSDFIVIDKLKSEPIKQVVIESANKETKTKLDNIMFDNKERENVIQRIQSKIEYLPDPIILNLEKAKKFNTIIPIEISAEIPSKELFNVLRANFENGEYKAIEYIVSNIDIEKIKNGLKKSLIDMYNKEDKEEKIKRK